jgi:hypothetical protein
MKPIVRLLLCCMLAGVSSAKMPEWITDTVTRPYTIQKADVEAIVLYSDTGVTQKRDTVTLHEKRIYRINRLEGHHYGTLHLEVVKGTRVSNFSGYRFNSSGELLETLRRRDLTRTAFSRDFYDDNEQVRASFDSIQTGDIVAFEYQMSWTPFCSNIVLPVGSRVEVVYKRIQIPDNARAVVLNDSDNRVQSDGISWFIQNQPALPDENNAPPIRESLPYLGIVFDADEQTTWESISRSFYFKTHEMCHLSDETIRSLQELTSISDQRTFILQTLNHVFESVRYVAIEVGEGRFIPTPADEVHQKKFGDCKDMAWYTIAILQQGGVTAHPVLSRTRTAGPVFETFPALQFNHAIIAVELNSQSIDLKNLEIDGKPFLIVDMTDRFTRPPMLGSHLENTTILPVTLPGSTLLTLPQSTSKESVNKKDVHITLHANRHADVSVKETLSGHFAAREKSLHERLTDEEVDRIYRNRIQRMFPGADVESFSFDINEDSLVNNMHFSAKNMGTDINNLVYLMPNLPYTNVTGYRVRSRDSDLVKSHLSSQHVVITVDIDSAFSVDSVPENMTMENKFFSASLETETKNNSVILDIHFSRHKHIIPSDQYSEYRKLYRDYLKSARSRIALSKNGTH